MEEEEEEEEEGLFKADAVGGGGESPIQKSPIKYPDVLLEIFEELLFMVSK